MPPSAALFLALALAAAVLWLARSRSGGELARSLLRPLVRTVYAIRTEHPERVPERGGALLVANHVSYADAFLIGASAPRPVRFLMHRSFFEQPLFGAFARWVGAIPIAAGESDEERERSLGAAAEALARGDLVAIFAEGRITRTGALLGFRRGLESIARRAGAPIVPVALDEVWGSIFSFERGRALTKWPRQLPYRVRVSFGAPMPPQTPAHLVRDALGELLARSAEQRALGELDLARAFVRRARSLSSQPALLQASGAGCTYRELLTTALAVSGELDRRLGRARRVGVLVPGGRSAVELHAALALCGRTAVVIDPRRGQACAAELLRKAEAEHVIGSAEGSAALDVHVGAQLGPARWIAVEELLSAAGRLARAARWRARLPASWILKTLPALPRTADEAVVLSTSGTSGLLRAAVLSHAAIASNARALAQVGELAAGDLVLSALPFTQAYGYTVTLWAPLLAGATLLLAEPSGSSTAIAQMARRHLPSVLVGVPSAYGALLGLLERSDARRVRLAICGGEHLPARLAAAWKEKLGCELLSGYGATELGPVVCGNLPDVQRSGLSQHNHSPGSVGRPLPGVAVRIVRGAGGEIAAPLERGSILVRGPGRMTGYLGDPAATAEVARDGWIDCGDVGALDRDGFLSVVDRSERFLLVGAELVAHAEIEDALRAGLPEGAGEIAVVRGAAGSSSSGVTVVHCLRRRELEDVRASALARGLPTSALPPCSEWIALPSLPRTPSGRLDLMALEFQVSEVRKSAEPR